MQPSRTGELGQPAEHGASKSSSASPSTAMQIERTTTPDGRLLLLYTFEDPDE
ncbi:MAG: hypothetical protein H0X37_22515 [Herpetosiphonaceae bacterium]|nr:hypothetical protein [Herpetosiphonaceae bacterium]